MHLNFQISDCRLCLKSTALSGGTPRQAIEQALKLFNALVGLPWVILDACPEAQDQPQIRST